MFFAEIPWEIFMTPFGIPIAAILCVFAYLVVASISESVAKVMCNRNDTELKTELLANGYNSEEIIRVVESGRTASVDTQNRAKSTGHVARV